MHSNRFFRSFSALGLILVFSQGSSANAAEVFRTQNVSQKAGGQLVYHDLDSSASSSLEITFSATRGEVHVGNIKAISENDEDIPFGMAKIIRSVPKDSKGRFILKAGSPTLRLAYSVENVIGVISYRAEAFSPGAELEVKVGDPGSEAPTPAPERPRGGDSRSSERECGNQILDVNSRLLSCTQGIQSATAEKARVEANIDNLQTALNNSQRPLQECSSRLGQVNDRLNAMRSRANDLSAEVSSLGSKLDEYRELFREARTNAFECHVVGRHEDFRAQGRTRAEALTAAFNLCGKNNCGKDNWSGQFDCRPIR